MKRIIFILLFLMLTACGALTSEDAAVSPPAEATAATEAIAAAQPAPTATVRIVMIATDPATFEQAAGRPQLVEFFAFW